MALIIVIGIIAPEPEAKPESGGTQDSIQTIEETPPVPVYDPNEAGTSRLEPAPFGLPIVHDDIEIRILAVVRGWEDGGLFNNPDPEHEWIAVRINLKYIAPPDDTKRYSVSDFRITGSQGLIYDEWFTPDTEKPLNSGEFFGGAEISGDIVQQVRQDDSNLVLIYSPAFKGSRYISLEAP